MRYPVYKPEITSKEKEYVMDCLESTWISSRGKYIDLFENEVAKFCDVKYAIAVSNGTVALHLALLAYGIGEGDEVIVPDFTYVATANAVKYVNADPVLVDVCKNTWNITLEKIEESITQNTKAIIVADMYGTPVDLEEIVSYANKKNIIVIHDAAESFGATINKKRTGSQAHITTFSFFGNKTITTGEGGMILTNDENICKLLRKLKNQGNSDTVRYFHDLLGYNYRMTNIQAAIGLAQIERIDDILDNKVRVFSQYNKNLNGHVKFQKVPDGITSSYWMVSILFENKYERDTVMSELSVDGIETRPFFIPIHKMPYFDKTDDVDNSLELSECGINLPSYPTLRNEDVDYISEKIKIILNKIRK